MADSLQFDLVSPEQKVASSEAKSVQIPGMLGDFTAMPQHSPFLSTIRPGIVKVTTESETFEYVVTGGFAEVTASATSILAEQAVPREDFDTAMLESLAADAEYGLNEATDDESRILASQRVRDVAYLKSQLGI
ncbi:MAG: ATP synthase F1 subunit epsilon [Pseudomonadota bacterium]